MTGAGPYVEWGGLAHAPGPLRIDGVTLWAHFFRADGDALRELLRRVFEDTTGGAVRCEPILDLVMLTCSDLPEIRTTDPAFAHTGYVRERNTAFWVPAKVRVGDEERFASFLFGMWVDDPIALVAGREVHGYRKHFGATRLPWPDDGGVLSLDSIAWDFREDEHPRMQPLLTLAPDAPVEGAALEAAEQEYDDLAALVDHLAPELRPDAPGAEGLGALWSLMVSSLRREMPQLFLRQLRDPGFAPAGEPAGGGLPQGTASHSEVLVFPAAPKGKLRVRRLGRHHLTIRAYDSHPVAAQLGLDAQHRSLAGVRVRMWFEIGRGEVLWRP